MNDVIRPAEGEPDPVCCLLLFASLRELAGSGSVKIPASNLLALVDAASESFGPEFAAAAARAVCAIDGETVPRDQWGSTPLMGTEEIALFPPVSGGSDDEVREGARVPAAVLTVSDRSASGESEDTSGPALVDFLETEGFEVVATAIVPDDAALIAGKLEGWTDFQTARLVVTTGGTGLGPRDVTPEATLSVIEKEAVGLGELMRRSSDEPRAALSRQIAGVRNGCLIVNVPGSRAAAIECMVSIVEVLEHAIHAASGGDHNTGV